MRDDRGADVHIGAQPADMIEVLMGIDEEANRLVRDELHDLLDHRQVSLLVERRFDDGDVVLELDGHTVVRRAAEKIDAVGQLLCLDANGKGRPGRTESGNGQRIGAGVRLDVLERAAEGVVAGGDGLRPEVVVPALVGCHTVGNLMPLPIST